MAAEERQAMRCSDAMRRIFGLPASENEREC
jgi:hypothetical protein